MATQELMFLRGRQASTLDVAIKGVRQKIETPNITFFDVGMLLA